MPSKTRLLDVLHSLKHVRLLVVGDVVADEYLFGSPRRLSREAPIPILEQTRHFFLPGGAGNVAQNATALGAAAMIVGTVGDDLAGNALCAALERSGVDTSGIIVDSTRYTSTKTRIIGGDEQTMPQQVARIDHIDRTFLQDGVTDAIAERSIHLLERADVALLSDYDIATITEPLITAFLPRAQAAGIPVIVDAHDQFARFRGIHTATPNQPEAEAELGESLLTNEQLHQGAEELTVRMDARAVLITRGALGMALHERGASTHFLPVATYSEVRDATGAGDTAATTYALAIAAGASLLEAAHLANIAAGVAVCKLGVATVSWSELYQAIASWKVS